MNFPIEQFERVYKYNDTWVVLLKLTPSLALCVREVDVEGGAEQLGVIVMEI